MAYVPSPFPGGAIPRINSGYGPRKSPTPGASTFHPGYDFQANQGTRLYAPVAGTVVYAGPNRGFGNQVVVRGDDGKVYSFNHLSEIGVRPGERVNRGSTFAKSGNTGVSTGPHLHMEVNRQPFQLAERTVGATPRPRGEPIAERPPVEPKIGPPRPLTAPPTASTKDKPVATPNRLDPAVLTGLALANSGQTKMTDLNRMMIADALSGRVTHPVDAIGRIAQVAGARYDEKRRGDAQKEAIAKAIATGNPAALIGLPGTAGKLGMLHYQSKLAAERDKASRAAALNDKIAYTTDPRVIAAKKATRPQTNVNVNTANQTAFAKKRGETDAKFYGEVQDRALKADDTLANVNEMRALLPKVQTGAGTETLIDVSKMAQRLGIDVEKLNLPKDVSGYEAFRNVAMNFVMQRIQDTKGAISDAEMKAFAKSVPTLSTTPEGIQTILGVMERIAVRRKEFFSRMQDYVRKHDGLNRKGGPSFMQEWNKYKRANPILKGIDLKSKSAVPQGYKHIGKTPDGRDVYEDPNGRRWAR